VSTFLEIQDRIEALVRLGGWSNAVPAPDYPFLGNEGLRLFSRQSQHNVEDVVITTVANQTAYSLFTGNPVDDRVWIAINDDALWNSGTLGAIWLPQATRNQLRAADREWRLRPAGNPEYWYWTKPGAEIGLWSIPSVSSITISMQGPRHEPEMVNDTDEPLLNEDFHEGICLFGAYHWGKTYARGAETDIVRGYYAEAMEYVSKCKQAMVNQEAGLISRRVQRPAQEYMGTGSMQIPYRPFPQ
jgi:hypothetical protein